MSDLNHLELARGHRNRFGKSVNCLYSQPGISDRLIGGDQPSRLCGPIASSEPALAGRRPGHAASDPAPAEVRGRLDSICRIGDTPHKATGFAQVRRVLTRATWRKL